MATEDMEIIDNVENYYVEVACHQRNHYGEHICGDVFRTKRIKNEERIIVVLSDGLGHGVKANVMATFTASFAINFTEEHKDCIKIADIIMNTLPVCMERKISYSTFTIVDIELNGKVNVLEYDNPETITMRYDEVLHVPWSLYVMDTEKNKGKILSTTSFIPQKEDRIIFFSDGVVQSGLGSKRYPNGWGVKNCRNFISKLISDNHDISASILSQKVVSQANINDSYHSKDDISCVAIYFRDPRKCLICSGPPFHKNRDKMFATNAANFQGKKIICGGTTSKIISRELNLKIDNTPDINYNFNLPPTSYMSGFDLVTEGILTLTKVYEKLQNYQAIDNKIGNSPADKIVSILLNSDKIYFQVGTGMNTTNSDPDIPVELELRRTVINKIAKVLEFNFLKDVTITMY